MSLLDLVVGPLYIMMILIVGYLYCRVLNVKLRKWFFWGLVAKVTGSVLFVLLYTTYYEGGDTLNYFKTGNIIVEAFKKSPEQGFKLFLSDTYDYSGNNLQYKGLSRFFRSQSSFLNVKVSAVLSSISFGSFLGTSLFFGLIAFWGSWSLFKVLNSMYPNQEKVFGMTTLLIPSVVLWSSGIMKDTLVFALLCWSFVFGHKIITRNQFYYLILFVPCLYYLTVLKAYVAMAFLPAFIMYLYSYYTESLKSLALKTLIQPILLFFVFFGIVNGLKILEDNNERFKLENLYEKAEVTRNFIYRTSLRGSKLQNRTGSEYELPDLSGNLSDVRVIPLSINVTLFRPYLFEVRNPVMLLASIESTLFLIVTIYVIFNVGVFRSIKYISADPFLIFCIIFTFGFALAVGYSTLNFGSLSRYKIPILPFYAAVLCIIQIKYKRRSSSYRTSSHSD